MKKRLFLNILALCLLLSALSPAVFATETTEPTQVVRAADECGEGIKWNYSDGVLTITGSGAMDDFTDGGAPWQAHKDEITEVVLEGGVTYIGAYAFKDCDNLLAVDFGGALYEIGTEAFRSCDGLTSIWLPASFKVFGESSFLSCEKLEEIHCSGGFPSFRQNCLWATYATIFFPAERPWGVEYIEQLETAFQGRIEFLASDGSDPYTPGEDATEPVQTEPEETVQETTEPDPTQMTVETEPQQTLPAPTEQETEPAETEAPATEPAATEAEEIEETEKTGSWIGIVVIVLVLCLLVLGGLIFGSRTRKKGRFSR